MRILFKTIELEVDVSWSTSFNNVTFKLEILILLTYNERLSMLLLL